MQKQLPMKNPSFFKAHMSALSNLIAAFVFGAGFISPVFSSELKSIGLFALSGGLTNWIAVHMLFEKVPGFYGSGVIVVKFKAFKSAIHELIMTEFFDSNYLASFFEDEDLGEKTIATELKKFLNKVNYEDIYEKLLNSLLESPVGPMLALVGGVKILEPAKPFFMETMKKNIEELAEKAAHDEGLKHSIQNLLSSKAFKRKIEKVILQRLDELTPNMVKKMVASIIKEHLGWLVVWGAVFGGMIGLVASFF